MQPSSSYVLIVIWTVLSSNIIRDMSALPPTLSPGEIEMYLQDYLQYHEIFPGSLLQDDLPATLQAFYDRYKDATRSSKGSLPAVLLKDTLEIYAAVERNVAVLRNSDECSYVDHVKPQYLQIFMRTKTDAERLADWKLLYPSPSPTPITEYCDFFSYLTCQAEPTSSTGYSCQCASKSSRIAEMDASKGKETCRFRKFQSCQLASPQLDGKYFPRWDFVEETFKKEIVEECETPTLCNYPQHVCNDPAVAVSYFRSFKYIAKALIDHLDEAGVTDASLRAEAMRAAIKMVKLNENHLLLSLEVEGKERLSWPGTSCDPISDAKYRNILAKYHYGEPVWHIATENQRKRIEYLKAIVGDGIKKTVCNHFFLFSCQNDTLSPNYGQCVCNQGLEWDPIKKHCILTDGETCSPGKGNSRQEFKLQFLPVAGAPGKASFFQQTEAIPCDSGSICFPIVGVIRKCLSADFSSKAIQDFHARWENKFVLNLNTNCDVAKHEALLGMSAPDYSMHTIAQKLAKIESELASLTLYCKVTQYQTCDLTTRKCKCLPNSNPNAVDQSCYAFLYNECGVVRSSVHIKFDDLALVPPSLRPLVPETLLCLRAFAICSNSIDPLVLGNVCHCNNLVGPLCNTPINRHAEFIMIENLDPSMRTSEGYKILDGLRAKMNNLETNMKIPYGAPCDDTVNNELSTILDFLKESRDCCTTTITGWSCRKPSDIPPCPLSTTLDITVFRATLSSVESLIVSGSLFCNRPNGVNCVMGSCQCQPQQFFQMGECTIELVQPCKPDRPSNDPFYPPCRAGLECDTVAQLCILSNSVACSGGTPATSLADAQKQEFDCLLLIVADLNDLRRKGNGNACNWVFEQKLQRALTGADAISDFNKFIGSDADRLQHIRMIQPLTKELDDMTDILYCSTDTPCSQEQEICTDGVNTFGQPKGSPANLPTPSQIRFLIFLHIACAFL